MKELLIAKSIRRLIEEPVQEFFIEKLDEFNGDLDAMLSSLDTIEELNNFLTSKEEEAIFLLKERHGIDFQNFDIITQRNILKNVEFKIYTNW